MKTIAEKSFNEEKPLYDLCEYDISNVETLFQKLSNSTDFDKFQSQLKKYIYKDAESFIPYFHDTDFIKLIAVRSAKDSEEKISNILAKSLNKAAIKAANIRGENFKEIEKGIDNLAINIANNLIKGEEAIFNQPIEENSEAYKSFISTLSEVLKGSEAEYKIGYQNKTTGDRLTVTQIFEGKAYQRELSSVKGKTKETQMTEIYEIIVSDDGEVIPKAKAIKPPFTLEEIKNFFSIAQTHGWTLDLQLYGENASTLVPMVEKAVDKFIAKNQNFSLKSEDGVNVRSENLFKIQMKDSGVATSLYNVNESELDWNSLPDLNKDAEKTSIAFLQVLQKCLKDIEIERGHPEKANEISEQFSEWAGLTSGLKNSFNAKEKMTKLIIDNPHLIYELVTSRVTTAVSGTLGEVLFSLFLQVFNSDSQTRGVQILGQTQGATGSAAVDIKMSINNLKNIGFQSKNITSEPKEVVIYSQSNKLSNEKYMRRYLESSALEVMKKIFFDYYPNQEQAAIFNRENWQERINQAEGILQKHIPYYLRFSEANLEEIDGDIAHNNFYIINFAFIPASVIFYTIYLSLLDEEKNQKMTEYFFLSKEAKSARGLLPSTNFMASWEGVYNDLYSVLEVKTEENFIKSIKENLYINFTGVKISFVDKFSAIFRNATK